MPNTLVAILLPVIACAPVTSEIEIVPDAQVGKNATPFRHVNKPAHDDFRGLFLLDRMSCEANGASLGAQHTGDCAIERRFADAIRTEDGNNFTFPHREIDAVQHFGLSITSVEVADGEQRISVHAAPPALPQRRDLNRPPRRRDPQRFPSACLWQ